jgi:hypothetical protein
MAEMGGSGRTRRLDDRDQISGDTFRSLVEETLLRPLAALLLIQSPLVGLGLWVPLFLTPSLALVGLSALIFMVALDRGLTQAGMVSLTIEFRANGLLAALVSFWVLAPIGLPGYTIAVAVGTAVIGALYLVFLGKSLHPEGGLPVTVWPYCIVAAMVLTLFSGTGQAPQVYFGWPDMSYEGWHDLPGAFLTALGVFVFSPSVISGAVIAFLVLLWSPVMFITGALGWLAGALFSIAVVSIGATVDWVPASYNSFLAGMALGAVFLVPGVHGLVVAAFAGALAALLAAFLQIQTNYSGISYLPIPFIITLYSGLATMTGMGLVGRDWGALALWERPETARISKDWLESRWGSKKSRLLGVPLNGPVEITQGVDGLLTHRGRWRYAVDFQRPEAQVAGDRDIGASLWGAEVFSPIKGDVVSVENAIPDNPIGTVNYGENWGNHVILRSDRQAHVAICHLMAGSVRVQPGQRVSFDTLIGHVGNSGRSAVPHLHMQRQSGPTLGAATQPFRLANYFEVDVVDGHYRRWRASGLPRERAIIAAAAQNRALHDLLTGMLPGRGLWIVSSQAPDAASGDGSVALTTSFTEDGLFRMESPEGDYFEAALDIDAFRVVTAACDRRGPVAALATAMSTIPYAAIPGITWDDALYLPVSLKSWSIRDLASPLLGTPLTHVASRFEALVDPAGVEIASTYTPDKKGAGYGMRLRLSPKRGPVYLSWASPQGSTTMELASFEVHTS